MATLTIEGRKVTVDDSFKAMSPEEQNKAVEEIAASLQIKPQNAQEQQFGGAGMNTTAGLNEALYGIAGAPVDLMRGAMNLASRGINAVAGTDLPQIPENSFGGSRSIAEGLGAVRPELDPRNTVATSAEERIARGVGQGVAGTVLPAGIVGAASRAGVLGPQAAQMGAQIAGRSSSVPAVAADALAGATAGGSASVAMEVTPDKYDPIAGMVGGLVGGGVGTLATGIPSAAVATGRAAQDFSAPLSQGGRERLAGQQIQDGATNPQLLRQTLEARPAPIVPGSQPTTFQQTGDMGVGALERNSQTKFPAEFQERRAEQNMARVTALEGIQPTGAAESVSKALRQRLSDIDRETQADFDMTRTTAQRRNQMIGASMRPEDAGETMRTVLQRRRDLAMERENRLWGAVDPDGTLALSLQNATALARSVDRDTPASAKPPSGEEAAIYDVLRQYGDVVPFRELAALRSRVSTAMADERGRHGKSPAWARLSQIRSAIETDIETAITAKVQRETEAVAAGKMREEDTLAAMLSRETEAWRAGREQQVLSANGAASPSGLAGGRTQTILGAPRAEGQARRGSTDAPRDPRLSPDDLEPSFDRAAQERLSAATEATRQRAGTFDNRTLGPVLARPADHAPYNMDDARVAARVFTPGTGGFERLQTFRQAGGTKKAMAAVDGYAIESLRKRAMNDDGTLDPAKVDQWRRAHADALRAFPELDIRVQDASRASETMAGIAAARKRALDEMQIGAVGDLIKSDNPQDVIRTVGQVLGRRDSVALLQSIKQKLGGNKDGQEGLQKAAAEYLARRLVGNTEVATSGQPGIKNDQFQSFIRQNRAGLRAVFSEDQVKTLEAIAADLQRANRSLTAVRTPGQSNTAQDTQSVLQKMVAAGMENWAVVAGGTAGAAVAGPLGALAGGSMASMFNAFRQNGINQIDELVRDALLDPERARILLTKVPASSSPREEASLMRTLAQRYMKTLVGTTAVGERDERQPLQITVTPKPSASITPPGPRGLMDVLGAGQSSATMPQIPVLPNGAAPLTSTRRNNLEIMLGTGR